MTEKLDKYILDVQIDNETGEEHCTVLKTDGTTNMANWIEIFSAMYTHHSILEPLIDELNKNYKGYSDTEKYAIKLWKENEQLKKRNENQYNQLTELWEIIEEENWEKLIAMKKQLKEDEERLQQEWKCYE